MLPNRIATYLLAFAGLAGAITPVVANFDVSSVIGWGAGLVALSTAGATWLLGWQRYEERTALEGLVEDQLGRPPLEGRPDA